MIMKHAVGKLTKTFSPFITRVTEQSNICLVSYLLKLNAVTAFKTPADVDSAVNDNTAGHYRRVITHCVWIYSTALSRFPWLHRPIGDYLCESDTDSLPVSLTRSQGALSVDDIIHREVRPLANQHRGCGVAKLIALAVNVAPNLFSTVGSLSFILFDCSTARGELLHSNKLLAYVCCS